MIEEKLKECKLKIIGELLKLSKRASVSFVVGTRLLVAIVDWNPQLLKDVSRLNSLRRVLFLECVKKGVAIRIEVKRKEVNHEKGDRSTSENS